MKKIILLLVVFIVGGTSFFMLSQAKTNNEEKNFYSDKLSNLKEISVEGNGDVCITTSDSKDLKCTLSIIKKGYVIGDIELDGKIQNDILYIKAVDKGHGVILFGEKTSKLNVTIPKKYKNKLFVKSNLGKIEIVNSKSKELQCDSRDAKTDLSLDEICGSVSVKSNLGGINLKLPKEEKFNLNAQSKLGKIKNNMPLSIDNTLKNKIITLKSEAGNISISSN